MLGSSAEERAAEADEATPVATPVAFAADTDAPTDGRTDGRTDGLTDATAFLLVALPRIRVKEVRELLELLELGGGAANREPRIRDELLDAGEEETAIP